MNTLQARHIYNCVTNYAPPSFVAHPPGVSEKQLNCHCDGMCPPNSVNNTCQTRPGGQCFSLVSEFVDDDTGILEQDHIYGCMSPETNGAIFQVSSHIRAIAAYARC